MGNINKKEKIKFKHLNYSMNFDLSNKEDMDLDKSEEDFTKSQILNINNIFSEYSNKDLINSTLIPSLDDNSFLGEYKDEFKNIKLIKQDLISNIYKAENIKDNRKVSLKVYNKKNLEKGDYDFFLEQIKREEEIIRLCRSDNIINIYRKMETLDNIIFEMESWETNLKIVVNLSAN